MRSVPAIQVQTLGAPVLIVRCYEFDVTDLGGCSVWSTIEVLLALYFIVKPFLSHDWLKFGSPAFFFAFVSWSAPPR